MIAIGSDHAGYNLKEEIIEQLKNMGYDILDIGCNGEACDYPDIASEVAGCIKIFKQWIILKEQQNIFLFSFDF